jgi:hypothetical protein
VSTQIKIKVGHSYLKGLIGGESSYIDAEAAIEIQFTRSFHTRAYLMLNSSKALTTRIRVKCSSIIEIPTHAYDLNAVQKIDSDTPSCKMQFSFRQSDTVLAFN